MRSHILGERRKFEHCINLMRKSSARTNTNPLACVRAHTHLSIIKTSLMMSRYTVSLMALMFLVAFVNAASAS
jgi:hypothetical protein